jgi:hypothetical protein
VAVRETDQFLGAAERIGMQSEFRGNAACALKTAENNAEISSQVGKFVPGDEATCGRKQLAQLSGTEGARRLPFEIDPTATALNGDHKERNLRDAITGKFPTCFAAAASGYQRCPARKLGAAAQPCEQMQDFRRGWKRIQPQFDQTRVRKSVLQLTLHHSGGCGGHNRTDFRSCKRHSVHHERARAQSHFYYALPKV